ncbi:MAG: hypothetical protein MJZ04_11415, partial [Bacteroidales bacterium]|nr:hypothetical protein [Bacteroidales bacterium]
MKLMMMGSVMMKNTCTGDVPSRHLRGMSAVQVPTDRRDLHHPHAVQAPERPSMLQVIFISASARAAPAAAAGKPLCGRRRAPQRPPQRQSLHCYGRHGSSEVMIRGLLKIAMKMPFFMANHAENPQIDTQMALFMSES